MNLGTAGRAVVVVLLALLIPIVPFLIVGELPGERWLHARDDTPLAFGLAGAGLLAADVVLPVPSSIIGTVLGARLGFVAGFAWSLGGLMLGNLVGFALGKLMFARCPSVLPDQPTALLLLLSRPVPVLAEAMTLAAGATRLSFATVMLATGIGNAAYAAALAGSGAAWLPEGVAGPGLVVPLLLPAVGWLIWKARNRTKK